VAFTRRMVALDSNTDKLEFLITKGIFFLLGYVDQRMASVFGLDVFYMLATVEDKTRPIWIIIDSPGGELTSGLAIYDTIRILVKSGRTVNILAMGDVSSMAGCIMQAGSRRYALPSTQFGVHQARIGPSDEKTEVNEMKDNARELDRLNDIVLGLISGRTGMPMKELKRKSKKTDLNLNAQEALSFGPHGLIDEITEVPPFLSIL